MLPGRVGKTINRYGADGRLVVAVVTGVLVTIISAFTRVSRVHRIDCAVWLWFPVSDPDNSG